MAVIPAQPNDLLITLLYDRDDAGEVIEMWDNHVIGWFFSDHSNPNDAWPLIITAIPEPPQPPTASTRPVLPRVPPGGGGPPGQDRPSLDEIIMPSWIAVFVPDKAVAQSGLWTGRPSEVFDYLSKGRFMLRRLRSHFVYPQVQLVWSQWKARNPNLWLEG